MSYIELLTPYIREMPNFSALCDAVFSQAEDLIAVIPDLISGFSLTSAVGIQLDQIGSSFGVDRMTGMSDADYRVFIRAKLALWRWDGTNLNLPVVLHDAFPDMNVVVTDNGDLTATVSGADDLPGNTEILVPYPAGVQLIVAES